METRENLPKSEHLILLVGSNPLPNAVAGRLLTADNAAITMLHSKGSSKVAQRLAGWLKSKPGIKPICKEVDESDPVSIAAGVKEELERVQASSVGLHYTGGTKTMGVHAYRAVKQWAEQPTHFSYLNARTLEMIFDPADPDSGELAKKKYVGNDVTIYLEELLKLHAWNDLRVCSISLKILYLSAGIA